MLPDFHTGKGSGEDGEKKEQEQNYWDLMKPFVFVRLIEENYTNNADFNC